MAAPDLKTLLGSSPRRPFSGRLVRCIPQLTFQKGRPPSYLFTSGAVNRCNPAGIKTLYMAEDRDTALAEYDSYYPTPEPELTYYASYVAGAVIDLGDLATRVHFGLSDDDFFKSFRLAKTPTILQQLGAEIAAQKVVTAIRFPSNARHRNGGLGFNFAIFRDSLQSPDSLSILGNPYPLESWP